MIDRRPPQQRIVEGQSLNGPYSGAKRHGAPRRAGRKMVYMASTSLLAVATLILSGSVRANDDAPHVAAVAVARAQILSGVRIAQDGRPAEPQTPTAPKPRERPCPDDADTRCRMIVVDMP